MNKYTSLELSKKLHENGCKIEGEYQRVCVYDQLGDFGMLSSEILKEGDFTQEMSEICSEGEDGQEPECKLKRYPAYDLIYDICIKYREEFFGEEFFGETHSRCIRVFILVAEEKIKEAEDYIWEHCLFNPKNK